MKRLFAMVGRGFFLGLLVIAPLVVVPAVETQVASGEDFSVLLDADGSVWAWGSNNFSQLGDNTTTDALTTPVRVLDSVGGNLGPMIAIAAGGDYNGSGAGPFALALRPDGTVVAWGDNSQGQCGGGASGSTKPRAAQVTVSGGANLTGIIAISAGVRHGLALRADGTVWAWGSNTSGQCGDGTQVSKPYAVQMSGVTDAIAVAAGGDHSLILRANGTILACGANGSGQIGDNSTATRLTPVPVYSDTSSTKLANVMSISAGRNASMALTADSTVYSWGSDQYGEIGNGSSDSSNKQIATYSTSGIKAISCGMWGHKWALNINGQLYGWGYNDDGRMGITGATSNTAPAAVSQPSGSLIRTFSAGRQVSAFITATGEVYGCGKNVSTPALVYASWSMQGAMQVAAGASHTLMLKADGTVWSYGQNGSGQLGDGTTTNRSVPVQVMADGVNPLTNVIAIAAGNSHSMALRADGVAYCWGDNSSGQIGIGSGTTNSLFPYPAHPYARLIAAAGLSSFAIHGGGYLAGWGNNGNGQLGNGTTTTQYTYNYAFIASGSYLNPIKAVSSSNLSTLAVMGNGQVRGSGYNYYGELGNPSPTTTNYFNVQPTGGITEVRQAAVGGYHAVFLLPNGTVMSSGYNGEGVLGNGTTSTAAPYAPPVATNMGGFLVKAVVASNGYNRSSWALLANGSVRGWGYNGYGELANNATGNASSPVIALGPDASTQFRVCQISGGENNLQALLADGNFRGAGYNAYGELGNGSTTDSPLLINPSSTWQPQVAISVTDASASETAGNTGAATVTRTLSTVGSLTVSLSYGGTAVFGSDYSAPTSVTFPPGSASQSVVVTPIDDQEDEDDETAIVSIGSGGTLYNASGSATITITDNDTAGFIVSPTTISTSENGGTANVTIRLTSQPTSDVTIGISSSNTQEATVSVSSLTFTSANWNVDQTIVVTGVPDSVDDGNQSYIIKTAAAQSSDPKYFKNNPADISGTSINVDTAGFTVGSPSGTTSESGTTATIAVVLNSKPTANVTIPVASSSTGEATVSPPSLTFTSANWNTPQNVTMTGVADQIDDGNQTYTVSFGPTASFDFNYNNKTPPSRINTNVDIDTALVLKSTATLILAEGGAATSFTAQLQTKPVGAVSVALSVADGQTLLGTASNDITYTARSLAFTSANWNVPQTVYAIAVDDPNIEASPHAGTISISTAGSADTVYAGLASSSITASITDNDAFGVLVSKPVLSTDESGASDTVTVTLAAKPTANVTLTLSIPTVTGSGSPSPRTEGNFTNSGAVSGSPITTNVVITPATWNTGVVVTVYGTHETVASQDGDKTYAVSVTGTTSTDANFNGKTVASLFSVTNTDIDQPGIVVQQLDASNAVDAITQVTEGGATDKYRVKLTVAPTNTVVVNIGVPGRVSASPPYLIFTPATWNAYQTVTLTAVDDQVAQGTQNLTITHTTASSTDAAYDSKTFASLGVTVIDNDAVGIAVTPTSGLTTAESGVVSTFTVVLTSQPLVPVSTPLSVSDAAEILISTDGTSYAASGNLTFTTANWYQARTVYVKGQDDSVADGNKPFTVVLGAASAVGDTNYNGRKPTDVIGVNADNDTAGVAVTPTSGLTTTEAAGAGHAITFSVVLTSQPTANVVLGVSSANTAEDTVSPSTLTFTTANWNTPHVVTVTGVDDQIADGNQTVSILLAADSTTTDLIYRNRTPPAVSVTNIDNDIAGFTVTPTSGLVVSETGTTAVFTVRLNSQPTSTVTIPLSASAPAEVSLSASALTFTTANWSTPQTVTITGLDDLVDDGDQLVTIALNLAISADSVYNGLDPADVSCTNTDNDTAAVTVAQVGPSSGGRLQTTEAGGAATFTVVLGCQPTGTVSIGLSSSNLAQGTVSPSGLTFTAATWNVPQTVTVTGAAAGPSEADVNYGVVLDNCLSSDPAYNGFFTQTVPCTNLKINNQPTLSPLADVTVNEDSAAASVSLVGIGPGQVREAGQTLAITATSDTPGLIPNPTVNATAGTISFQPVADGFGSAKITVTVTDNGGTARTGDIDTISRQFTVTVSPVNDVPSFTKGADVTVGEDVGAQTVAGWAGAIVVGPANEATQVPSFLVAATDTTLFAVQPQVSPTGDLTFTPAANAFGSTAVSVRIQDDGTTLNGGVDTSVAQTFTITILPANDAPVFTKGIDLSLPEDSAAQTVTGWATGIAAGAANESAQTLSFSLSADLPILFAVQPALTVDGTLTFAPAPEASGRAIVTVLLHDNGGTANGGVDTSAAQTFTITLVPVNDAPVAVSSAAASRQVLIGGTTVIHGAVNGATDLYATDVDGAVAAPARDPMLIFTLQLVPGAGQLLRSGVVLALNDTFTQQDLIDGLISYHHNGGSGSTDGFAFTVTDSGIAAGAAYTGSPALPSATSTPQVFAISIDRRPPLVQLLGSTPAFTENQPSAVLVADGATVSDSDSTDFATGTIRVSSPGAFGAQVVLSLVDQGTGADQVSIAGSTVRVTQTGTGTVDVGTLSGGNGTDLLISCTANMTPAAAQLVLRALQFTTASDNPPGGVPITVMITDDHGDISAPAGTTVVVTPVNDPPTASAALVTTVANQAVDGRIAVTDVDNTTFSFAVTQSPAKGTLSAIAGDGSFTYTPALDQSGADQFTVLVDDLSGGTVSVTVQISISGAGSTGRPWITSDPPVEIQAGDLLRTTIRVDTSGLPSGFDVEFSVIGGPAGMAAPVKSAADTAVLTWTAALPSSGNHVAFRIRATDAATGVASEQPVLLFVHPTTGGAN